MAAYDLEEQEQLAQLKAWWKQHGNLVLSIITAVLLTLAVWNGWRWYERTQSAEASLLYEGLQQAARAGDVKAARDAAGTILEKYSRTSYAALAALVSAKVHFQAGDAKTAHAQLRWVIDNAKLDEVRAVARLRLAAVLMDESALDDAMRAVEGPVPTGFEGLFASMRGDIFAAQKKTAEARAAYKTAMDKLGTGNAGLRESLRLKLDALGES